VFDGVGSLNTGSGVSCSLVVGFRIERRCGQSPNMIGTGHLKLRTGGATGARESGILWALQARVSTGTKLGHGGYPDDNLGMI
jgi:hypothetical protein